jgi:hypothetical protein
MIVAGCVMSLTSHLGAYTFVEPALAYSPSR